MNEGFPSAQKLTAESEPIQEEGWVSKVEAPEFWESRQELPWSKEYIGFQIKVARELSRKLNLPMSKIVDNYTPVFHPYIWPGTENYLDIDSMTDEQIEEAIYEKEKAESEKQSPTVYNEYHRYGCFSYMPHIGETGEELKGRIDIHFSNAEFDETGPLDKNKTERRLRELKDMFTEIKKEYPDAKFVRGDSWLYNIEAYRRLFPESYIAHPEIDESPSVAGSGRVWGQFVDNHLGLKKDLAEKFLKNIENLDEVTPDTVRRALPLQALIVTAPIEDFYKKYGIE